MRQVIFPPPIVERGTSDQHRARHCHGDVHESHVGFTSGNRYELQADRDVAVKARPGSLQQDWAAPLSLSEMDAVLFVLRAHVLQDVAIRY